MCTKSLKVAGSVCFGRSEADGRCKREGRKIEVGECTRVLVSGV